MTFTVSRAAHTIDFTRCHFYGRMFLSFGYIKIFCFLPCTAYCSKILLLQMQNGNEKKILDVRRYCFKVSYNEIHLVNLETVRTSTLRALNCFYLFPQLSLSIHI